MFEELKNQLDNLAQEVALLKEQQALQTGECRWQPLGRSAPETGSGQGSGQGSRQAAPAQSPARTQAQLPGQPCRPRRQVQGAPPWPASSRTDPLTCVHRGIFSKDKNSPTRMHDRPPGAGPQEHCVEQGQRRS